MKLRAWILGALGATGLLTLSLMVGCHESQAAAESPAPPPATAAATNPATASAPTRPLVEVRRQTMRRYAPAVGTLRAARTTRLAPQVSGRVQDVLVDVGDYVAQGQLLVQLDPVLFELEVQQRAAGVEAARGSLASGEVDVSDAKREMDRQLDLYAKGVGTVKDRDDAIAAHQRALAGLQERTARLAEAEKGLQYAQQQLKETEIRAPYDGAVTARLVDPGEAAMTMPPTTVAEVREVDRLYLEFSLPQELLDRVGVGAAIEYDVEGARNTADVDRIAVIYPAIDEATRSFRCRAVIDNRDHEYQPGLLARVRVVTNEVPDALVVPRTALSQTAGGWQVMLPGQSGPTPHTVQVGLITDDWAQITNGLGEGDQVVAAPGTHS